MRFKASGIVLVPNALLGIYTDPDTKIQSERRGPALALILKTQGSSILVNINGKDQGKGLWVEKKDVFLLVEKTKLELKERHTNLLFTVIESALYTPPFSLSIKTQFLLEALEKVEEKTVEEESPTCCPLHNGIS